LGLRLLYFAYLVLPIAVTYIHSRRLLAFMTMGAILAGEALFSEILNRLDGGMTYGHGGYLIFLYSPLLLLAGYSSLLNLVYLILAAALPQALALWGLMPGFQHSHYAVLIWPTTATMMLGQLAYSYSYWRRRRSESALQLALITDPLTGAYNRRHFAPMMQREVAQACRSRGRLSLLMLDIDNFKCINDTHGHPIGDQVICALAVICLQGAREGDVVARMGGEEFAVLLPDAGITQAVQVAERIQREVVAAEIPSATSGAGTGAGARETPVHFTVSIGIAELQSNTMTEEGLVKAADAAMYQAKAAGRNRIHVAVASRPEPTTSA
jgi:diguanylate cyclase (GGDEF)-like protein